MDKDTEERGQTPYPGEKARQGKIILQHKRSRFIFIAALVAMVLLAAGAYWW